MTTKEFSAWIEQQLGTFKGCEHLFLKSVTKANYGKYAKNDLTIKTRILLQSKEHDLIKVFVPCYYTLTEITQALKNGYQLVWKFKENHLLRDSEITLEKSTIVQ